MKRDLVNMRGEIKEGVEKDSIFSSRRDRADDLAIMMMMLNKK